MPLPTGPLSILLLLLSGVGLRSVNSEAGAADGVYGNYAGLNEEGSSSKPHSTTNSSRAAAFPCPAEAAITPCVCSVAADAIDLDCTFVESEEQLAMVFLQEFPVKELRQFSMANNSEIRVLGNILNGVTFEMINLSPGPFVLQAISEYFFLDSRLRLSYLCITISDLLSGTFPFASLIAMEALKSMIIDGSDFTWIPKINSPKMETLSLTSGLTDAVEAGTFDDVPNLSSLSLVFNSITKLRAGAVPIHEGPMTFDSNYNAIQSLEPGTFFFFDSNSATNNEQISIYLSYNQLQSLQAGTFPFRDGAVDLQLVGNQIATIEPGTFVLPETPGNETFGNITIHLEHNQLQSLRAGTYPLRNGPAEYHFYSNSIASIEPGTFALPETTDSFSLNLNLLNNELRTFDEAVFGDVMPFITELRLEDNPLTCGCDIAWLVTNLVYIAKIYKGAACADGTLLSDLDPQYYLEFC